MQCKCWACHSNPTTSARSLPPPMIVSILWQTSSLLPITATSCGFLQCAVNIGKSSFYLPAYVGAKMVGVPFAGRSIALLDNLHPPNCHGRIAALKDANNVYRSQQSYRGTWDPPEITKHLLPTTGKFAFRFTNDFALTSSVLRAAAV